MTFNPTAQILAISFSVLFLANCTSTKKYEVPPDHAGVVSNDAEGPLDTLLLAGSHDIPQNWQVTIYAVNEQSSLLELSVLSAEGSKVSAKFNVHTTLKANSLHALHKMFGESYMEKYVVPESRAVCRQVCGEMLIEELSQEAVRVPLSAGLQDKLARYDLFETVAVSDLEIIRPEGFEQRVDVRLRHIKKNFKTSTKEEKTAFIHELFEMGLSQSKRVILALLEEEDLDDELKELITSKLDDLEEAAK